MGEPLYEPDWRRLQENLVGAHERIKVLEDTAAAYMNRTWDLLLPGNLSQPDPKLAKAAWEKADDDLRDALAGEVSRG